MKQNKYDDEAFFQKYGQMARSRQGLEGAGEWSELQKVLPDFAGKRVLDLGCGYGWHCRYAAENGAEMCIRDRNRQGNGTMVLVSGRNGMDFGGLLEAERSVPAGISMYR